MPELPEVEGFRRFFEAAVKNRKIQDITTHNEGRMFTADKGVIRSAMVGKGFRKTVRTGKYLFAPIDGGPVLMFHFGMSGNFSLSSPGEERPRFARIIFVLDDGTRLNFESQRKFSRLDLGDNLKTLSQKYNLGEDATRITKEGFISAFAQKTGLIKPLLLDQSRVAGIGNWIADEMFYRAGLAPTLRGSDIDVEEWGSLWEVLQEILQESLPLVTMGKRFPEHFFTAHRWGDEQCPKGHGDLSKLKVGGRTTYFCSVCQPGKD